MKSQYNPDIHHRKSIRLKDHNYSQPGYYFITICTKNRKYHFGEIQNNKMHLSPIGEIVQLCWNDLPKNYKNCMLDEFIIMPNHIHGIICIMVEAIHELPLPSPQLPQPHELPQQQRRSMIIPKIIGKFKMQSAKMANTIQNTPGKPFWQRNYYEHIIRNRHTLNCIREYIKNNPKKWELDRNNRHKPS